MKAKTRTRPPSFMVWVLDRAWPLIYWSVATVASILTGLMAETLFLQQAGVIGLVVFFGLMGFTGLMVGLVWMHEERDLEPVPLLVYATALGLFVGVSSFWESGVIMTGTWVVAFLAGASARWARFN